MEARARRGRAQRTSVGVVLHAGPAITSLKGQAASKVDSTSWCGTAWCDALVRTVKAVWVVLVSSRVCLTLPTKNKLTLSFETGEWNGKLEKISPNAVH